MRKRKVLVAAVVCIVLLGVLVVSQQPAGPDPATLIAAAEQYDVRILRDTWGVPHVFGATDADVAYGLGYAHAEDDFATIQNSLLASRGQLASVYGKDAAPNDYMVHLLRIRDAVDAKYETDLSPETRAICEAYAAGGNHYAALHPDEVKPGVLPFRGKDVVAGFVHKTPLFFGLDGTLGRLFGPERRGNVSKRSTAQAGPMPVLALGSNTFSVGPSRSADGKTRIAINSHQPWEGPVTWYEAHLHSDDGWDTVGGVFPGTPIILHGHNRDLGWAHTVNSPDLIDVYVLDIDPDNPNRYKYDGKWRDLEVRTAPIKVKLFGPISWTFKREALWSVYGPVMRQDHGTYAIRFAGMGDVRQVEQWYRMNKARNFDEWQDAMRMGAIPMFNCGYADREGNIYYLYNALLPIRNEAYDWSQYLPGDTSETLWTEYLPFDKLPQIKNPPSGFIQNCNSSPFQTTVGPGNPKPEDFSPTFGIETRMSNRALRARELFGADESVTEEEFYTYKYDMAYSKESYVADAVQKILDAPPPDDPVVQEALDILRAWDLRVNPENTGAALGVFSAWAIVRERKNSEPEAMAAFADVARTLKEAHGRIDVPWHEANRLHRGTVDVGLGGGPDVLHAVSGRPENGRMTGSSGDCYVLMVAWGEDGVASRSIHQYGSATLDETSPHYADQVPLFVKRQMKPVWLDEADIRANLEREYRPGDEMTM